MSELHRFGELEVDQDLTFEKRQQRIQRVSWAIGLVIILGALVGAFGNGFLSQGRAQSRDGLLIVKYERLGRNQSPGTMTFEVTASAVKDGHFTIGLPVSYLDSARIRHIAPQPTQTVAAGGELLFHFAHDGSNTPGHVIFEFEHQHFGLLKCAARLPGDTAVSFNQFIYP